MKETSFILKGSICYSQSLSKLNTLENGYLVCVNGLSQGAYTSLPEEFNKLPIYDFGHSLILPGLTDLHVHAPQYAFRGIGMDLELLDWLNTYTFPEESKYIKMDYAKAAYADFVQALRRGPNTRASIFATIHPESTLLLMDMLESSGLVSMVGKVNMNRNSPDALCESSIEPTYEWLKSSLAQNYQRTTPIITPRFIPSCSDDFMQQIKKAQVTYDLPVQSHLSENPSEVAWVQELCPKSTCYGDAYLQFGFFGGDTRTIMAHSVWSTEEEIALLREQGVFVAHCPQSNMNLSSGIAPIRRYLAEGIPVGLGSDIAGGCNGSIFRAMSDAIQVSKLYWRLISPESAPLTIEEAFYLGTIGSGSFFGRVGSFEPDYEFDAIVIDDHDLQPPYPLTIPERLAKIIYLSNNEHMQAKFVRGQRLF